MKDLQTLSSQMMVMVPPAEVAYRVERIRRDFERTGGRRRTRRDRRDGAAGSIDGN